MKILLAHNSLYYPFAGGGDKSNRLLMEAMVRLGHEVRVVSRVEEFGLPAQEELLEGLQARGIEEVRLERGAAVFTLNNVEIHTITLDPNIRAYFESQIAAFDPDVIVTSTDDPAQILFEVALRAPRARVVYLVRATIAAPFGPDSSSLSAARTERLKGADGCVGVSEYVAEYARRWGGLDAIHVPISLLEGGAPPMLGRFENPYVLMVNPCAVKGIAIFAELARRLPGVRFGAVPAWGTTPEDRALLASLPNVTLLGFRDNIDELLSLARVTLVPSLWAEARSRMVLESFSRGVPVMAADTGGLHEAMLGVDYLLPVNPVRRYQPAVNRQMVPIADVPPQDASPWEKVLRRLVTDREHWTELSQRSRDAALRYAESLDGRSFAAYLEQVLTKPKRVSAGTVTRDLSPEKKKLLELRMRQRSNPWLPGVEPAAKKPRLVVIPHAGSGAGPYLNWKPSLPDWEVCPVVLPGRETRLREPALESMTQLVGALDAALAPYLDGPFILFGHSMGAGVAFEWTHQRLARGATLPLALVLSSARAPALRSGVLLEPEEHELIAQLEANLGRTLTASERDLLLPAVRIDTRLYRQWLPVSRPPLPIPFFIYGGDADGSLPPAALEPWKLESSVRSQVRLFPGGHFYFQQRPDDFFETLRRDLAAESL